MKLAAHNCNNEAEKTVQATESNMRTANREARNWELMQGFLGLGNPDLDKIQLEFPGLRDWVLEAAKSREDMFIEPRKEAEVEGAGGEPGLGETDLAAE